MYNNDSLTLQTENMKEQYLIKKMQIQMTYLVRHIEINKLFKTRPDHGTAVIVVVVGAAIVVVVRPSSSGIYHHHHQTIIKK